MYVTAVPAEGHRGKDLKLGQPDQRVMTSTWHKAMASLSPAPARSDAAPQMDIRLETHCQPGTGLQGVPRIYANVRGQQ